MAFECSDCSFGKVVAVIVGSKDSDSLVLSLVGISDVLVCDGGGVGLAVLVRADGLCRCRCQ